MAKLNVLGRGLHSLIGEKIERIDHNIITNQCFVDINDIEPNLLQARKYFDKDKLQELANSITSNGLIQPIVVTEVSDKKYQIIAGERRYRACKLLSMEKIPVIIKHLSKRNIYEISLIENIQRENLNPIEESEGLKQLIDEFQYSHEELANIIGKSRSYISNLLRLLKLPDMVQNLVMQKKITMGQARCLIGLDNPEKLVQRVLNEGLSVRQLESLVQIRKKNDTHQKKNCNLDDIASRPVATENQQDNDLLLITESLSMKFNMKVKLDNSSKCGKLSFYYRDLYELDELLSKLDKLK
ncbi:ParB/RepB/Spo0J family partition protein [Rickettsia endosymbiont of Cardiosporidium cionae]|uniref:ParB/RepB/Spo0J family partition protein n=1 Tax=Rickettsia endosymbiont of Cardiosporidium cionae TaxID=2777155 RepID=UPI001892DB28|nr:ParB/RepB/Spo0J family partition protein [Rickettsia endosymbiont of Cardiosporidium cionae]KAF8818285.1 chromosome partitioning protein ParB [Rickettsia endosymbiont of Cardiosporidium cionae]